MSEISKHDKAQIPEPKSWLGRAGAAPLVPGSVEGLVANLRAVLTEIDKDPNPDRNMTWPEGGRTSTIRQAIHGLGACGLIGRAGRPPRAALTDEARHFLETGDMLYLIGLFHANVRFIGEALHELGERRTHKELARIAEDEYGLWRSDDQIRRRVFWFRATGLVQLWTNREIERTELGADLCARLVAARPNDLPHRQEWAEPESVSLPPTPPAIAAKLDALTEDALKKRRDQYGFVAGGNSIGTLQRLISTAVPEVTRDDFRRFCVEQFAVKKASAEQALGTLRAFGFIEQTGLDSFAATAQALEWLNTDESVDAIRIMHVHVALIGEAVAALEHQQTSGEVLKHLTEQYPQHVLSRGDLGHRLRLLQDAGMVERTGYSRYRTTPLGTAFIRSVPLEDPTPDRGAERTTATREVSQSERTSDAVSLAAEVVEASTDSANWKRFEQATEDCFRMIGLEVERAGTPGRADCVVAIWLSPTEQRRVIIEAKTDGAGRVEERAVNLEALEDHRKHHQADHIAIVGPAFGGRLPQWAASKKIALITARELGDWVLRQSRAPLYPYELVAMFLPEGRGELEQAWRAVEQQQAVLANVAELLWMSANDADEIQYSQGALLVREVRRMVRDRIETALDEAAVNDALSFLSTRLVAGVASRKETEYVITAPPDLIAARLRALADAFHRISLPRSTPGRDAR
jgi:hypothetical protein